MIKCKRLLCLLLALATVLSLCAVGFTASAAEVEVAEVSAVTPTAANDFTWDNATVYFLLTDRFSNGNTGNDNSYNRGLNQDGSKANYNNVAAFQGGDFKGITQKINDGYFDDLGINAIWVAGWFEQTHGYVVGGDGKSSFPHYSYHGYYGLDFTELDKNYGTEAEFKEMITAAHKHGIRIVLDVVMNHPGYNSIYDMNEYGFGTLTNNWASVYYNWNGINQTNYHGCIKYNDGQASDWAKWWGRDWIRAGMAGYDNNGGGDLTGAVTYLPDFKTESTATVSIPEVLKTKWNREGTYSTKVSEIDETFSKYNLGSKTVTNYLVAWYAKWVEEYGIDGFRCDTAKHVDISSWKKLSDACTKALENWRKDNPNEIGAQWDEEFWMTGENFGQGLDKNHYYSNGFDSMINFSFSGNSQGGGCDGLKKVGNLNQTYQDYANKINSDDSFNALTYISSHDTGLCRNDLYYQGSALLLLPGGVQIFYGDETNRQYVQCSIHDHESRSFMNWNGMDKNVLEHWQKVGTFRNNHVAVGAGSHTGLQATSGTAFARTYNKGNVKDVVACVIGANKNTSVTVTLNNTFADGTKLTNTYTGETATVSGGKVTVNSGAQGTILLESDGQGTIEPTSTAPATTVTNPIATTTAAPVNTTVADDTDPTTKPVEITTGSVDPSESEPIITVPKPTATPATSAVNTTVPSGEAEYVMLGDVDFTGKVNIKDATLIQKHLARIETLSEKAQFAGDIDGSEVLNIRDVTYIQKWLAMMKVDFAVGEQVLYKDAVIVIPTDTKPAVPTQATTTAAAADDPTEITTAPITTAPFTTEPQYTTAAPTTEMPTTETTIPTETTTAPTDIPTDPVGGDTITIYFENDKGWNNVFYHAWNSAGGTNTPWPGDPMENVGGNTYKAEVDASFTGIVFNDGTGSDSAKTTDLTIPGDGQIYKGGSWSAYDSSSGGSTGGDTPVPPTPGSGRTIYFTNKNNWSEVNIYCWNNAGGKNGEWPGVQMTLVEDDNGLGQKVYSYDVPAEYNYIIFNGNGQQSEDICLDGISDNGFILNGTVVNDKGHFGYDTYVR